MARPGIDNTRQPDSGPKLRYVQIYSVTAHVASVYTLRWNGSAWITYGGLYAISGSFETGDAGKQLWVIWRTDSKKWEPFFSAGTDRLVAAGTDDTAPATLIQKLAPTGTYNSSTDRLAKFEEFDDAGVKKVRGFLDISDFITSGSEKRRLISGVVYSFVAANDFSVDINNIQVLAGGLDPRVTPGDPAEVVHVIKNSQFGILNVGDFVACAWDASASEWYIIPTERFRLIRGVVKATVYSTNPVIVVDHVVATATGDDPRIDPTDATEEVEISNLFSRSYSAGDIIDAVWNPLNQEWEPISPERFRAIRGKCAAAVLATDLTFNINNVAVLDSGLDPRVDPTDATETVEIQNVIDAGEAHAMGDWVWADFNLKDGVWEVRPKGGRSANGPCLAIVTEAAGKNKSSPGKCRKLDINLMSEDTEIEFYSAHQYSPCPIDERIQLFTVSGVQHTMFGDIPVDVNFGLLTDCVVELQQRIGGSASTKSLVGGASPDDLHFAGAECP